MKVKCIKCHKFVECKDTSFSNYFNARICSKCKKKFDGSRKINIKSSICTARIEFGDDYGDNKTTFNCQLKKRHEGNHKETGYQYGRKYSLSWKRR